MVTARRVLFPFVGNTIGGSHISTLTLAAGLDRTRFDPVIALHHEGQLADHLHDQGTPYVRVPHVMTVGTGRVLPRFAAATRCAITLAPFLRQNKISVVHTGDMAMHLTWGLAARMAGAKFVWHQRSPTDLGRSEAFTNLANAILVISEFCLQSYKGRANRRALIVPNPIVDDTRCWNRQIARAQILERLSAAPDSFIVAFVGNLTSRKRPLVFVEAAARLTDQFGPRVKFLLFGEERMPVAAEVRRRIAELRLESTCHIMGACFPIEEWLAGCDLLLAPAVNEGFGRVLVEAMRVGTPVIAAASGGHVEIIETGINGILSPPDNPEALAGTAAELLESPARAAELAERALAIAGERYGVKRHVAQVEGVYTELFR
jgi:glycosyltransferase involved in cell wall biosynthesis